MKMLNNVNLANINAENGLDSALVFTARDKKVMSAIGHGLMAAVYGYTAACGACAAYDCTKVVANKVEDPGTRVIAGCVGATAGIATGIYGHSAYTEACKAIADVREAIKMDK